MKDIFKTYEDKLVKQGFVFERTDFNRPWGGFFVIEENQADQFIKTYFPDQSTEELVQNLKVSPKILIVAPEKRLSWQYHHRRKEVWRVIKGPVAVASSKTDLQPEPNIFNEGELIILGCGERHRLIGLEKPGVVAEIWQHTCTNNPSDEDDIIRLQDDFGRK